jgi:hypothetical protein
VEQTKRETPVKYIGTKDVQTSERRATDEGNHTGETKETLLPLLLGIDIDIDFAERKLRSKRDFLDVFYRHANPTQDITLFKGKLAGWPSQMGGYHL